MAGARPDTVTRATTIVTTEGAISSNEGEYRRSYSGSGLGDYLIAATALAEGLELAALNVRH